MASLLIRPGESRPYPPAVLNRNWLALLKPHISLLTEESDYFKLSDTHFSFPNESEQPSKQIYYSSCVNSSCQRREEMNLKEIPGRISVDLNIKNHGFILNLSTRGDKCKNCSPDVREVANKFSFSGCFILPAICPKMEIIFNIIELGGNCPFILGRWNSGEWTQGDTCLFQWLTSGRHEAGWICQDLIVLFWGLHAPAQGTRMGLWDLIRNSYISPSKSASA